MKHTPLLFLSFLLVACSPKDELGLPGDPANLTIEITVSDEMEGVVSVVAQAVNVAFYEFDMGDGSEVIVDASGSIAHTYYESNFYTISVKAIGSSGRYLKKSKQIAIELSSGVIDDGYSSPLSYDGYSLIWQDEFNGSGLDQTKWSYEIGDGCDKGICGWGNNELQYYAEENSSVADGYLTITARKELKGTSSYTSSRLITQDKFEFRYGRVDIRAKMPEGQGIWPALWMLGANIDQISWPACGEVDIVEMIGGGEGRDDTAYGTVHWSNAGNHAEHGGSSTLLTGNLSDMFHVYSIVWSESAIVWYIDDNLYHSTSLSDREKSEFLQDFFLIMNIAVGGNWPGNPDSSTIFPQKMTVDYVRVFQPD